MPSAPRLAPRYGRFVATGAVLGIALAAVAAALATGDARYTWADVFRYLSVVGALLGGLAGGGLAAWLDRPGRDGGPPVTAGSPAAAPVEEPSPDA